ncbi:MAG: hypothetical protein HY367_02275 [Candidatus Aenigmarchaeota archaeon]|nr:hypothetical protein [Candidatus Aenigmarchaeota archaeon]
MAKMLFVFLLASVVIVSGCTLPGQQVLYENDIVIIRDLQAVPSTITPQQSVRVIATVQNKGNKPIDNVFVDLFDHCEGLFPKNQISNVNCGGGDAVTGTQCSIKLEAQETKQVSWQLKPKEDIKLKTICPQDGMKVSVKYPETTTSITTVSFISRAEQDRQLQAGTLAPVDSYIAAGEGPIKPFLSVEDSQPIPTDSGSTPVSLQVKNLGGGFLADNTEIVIEKIDFGDLQIDGSVQCHEVMKGADKLVPLIQKESSKFFCSIIPPQTETQTTRTITTEISYIYEFRSSVKVTVEPKF